MSTFSEPRSTSNLQEALQSQVEYILKIALLIDPRMSNIRKDQLRSHLTLIVSSMGTLQDIGATLDMRLSADLSTSILSIRILELLFGRPDAQGYKFFSKPPPRQLEIEAHLRRQLALLQQGQTLDQVLGSPDPSSPPHNIDQMNLQ